MNITHQNYEVWAVNYLEGILSPSDAAIFLAFLAENPQLAEEFTALRNAFTEIPYEKHPAVFDHLKKDISSLDITENNFEEACIMFYEGDLDESSTERLLHFIGQNKERKYVFNSYKTIRLVADSAIQFPDKEKLCAFPFPERRKPRIPLLQYAGVAAVILLLLTLYFTLFFNPAINNTESFNNLTIAATISGENALQEENIGSDTNVPLIAEHLSTINEETSKWTLPTKIAEYNAVDTATSEEVFIHIARIEINEIESSVSESKLLDSKYRSNTYRGSVLAETHSLKALQEKSADVFESIRTLNMNTLLNKSVESINQLAETELKYNGEVDENGRLLAFSISSEQFNLKRKIRNN
jgi:hypothetical protein